MYKWMLLLHSYNRWLVIFLLVLVLGFMGWSLLRQKEWSKTHTRLGLALRMAVNIQFLLGVVLYVLPQSLPRGAWRDIGASMRIDELRFFAFEHPLQMFIAVALIDMGWHRAEKAETRQMKFRWSALTYTLATILILSIIPWWRPMLRPFNPDSEVDAKIADYTQLEGEGDAARGKKLFAEGVGGLPSCETCHTTDDTRRVGPGLGNIGLVANERVSGQSAEQYLLASIVEPDKYVVDDYSNIMPTGFGEALTEQQLLDLIAYLLSLHED